jgi:hypothetical protein
MIHDPDAYGSIVVDFMHRTKKNLIYIDRQVALMKSRGQKPQLFEVTQLINSALGIFVFPSEEILSKLVDTPLNQMECPVLRPFVATNTEMPFSNLIKKMRNAFAHHNFKLLSSQGHIEAIQIWNFDLLRSEERQQERPIRVVTWNGLTLTVQQLHDFMMFFVDGVIENTLTTERWNGLILADAV